MALSRTGGVRRVLFHQRWAVMTALTVAGVAGDPGETPAGRGANDDLVANGTLRVEYNRALRTTVGASSSQYFSRAARTCVSSGV